MAIVKFKQLDQFKLELKQFKKLTEKQSAALIKKVAFQVLKGVVEKTPVDTGRARGNWQVAVDIGAGTAEIARDDPSGEAEASLSEGTSVTLGDGLNDLARVGPYSTVVIFNNVEYIVALEYGHSQRQAPRGMVRLTIAEVNSQFT